MECEPRNEICIIHARTIPNQTHTQPLTPEEMAQAGPEQIDIAGLIAQELARMHAMRVAVPGKNGSDGDGERTAVLWDKMGQWARLAEGESERVGCCWLLLWSWVLLAPVLIGTQPHRTITSKTLMGPRHRLRRRRGAAEAAGGNRAGAAGGGDGLAPGAVGGG